MKGYDNEDQDFSHAHSVIKLPCFGLYTRKLTPISLNQETISHHVERQMDNKYQTLIKSRVLSQKKCQDRHKTTIYACIYKKNKKKKKERQHYEEQKKKQRDRNDTKKKRRHY